MNEQMIAIAFLLCIWGVGLAVGAFIVLKERRDQQRRREERKAEHNAYAASRPYPPMKDEYYS